MYYSLIYFLLFIRKSFFIHAAHLLNAYYEYPFENCELGWYFRAKILKVIFLLQIFKKTIFLTIAETWSWYFLIRNSHGVLIEAFSGCKGGQMDPALNWVKEKNSKDVEVETDCLVVVQAIKCSTITLLYFSRVVDDYKPLLSQFK